MLYDELRMREFFEPLIFFYLNKVEKMKKTKEDKIVERYMAWRRTLSPARRKMLDQVIVIAFQGTLGWAKVNNVTDVRRIQKLEAELEYTRGLVQTLNADKKELKRKLKAANEFIEGL